MKIRLMLSLFLVNVMLSAFAEEGTLSLSQRLTERPNRLYFGPECLLFQANTHVKNTYVGGHRFFWGLRLGYEYLKPQAFYAAAEIFALNAANGFSVSNADLFYTGKGGAGFGSIQTRFGYALSKTPHLVTPYLGVGMYSLSKYSHNGFKEGTGYLAAGVRSQFECSSICTIGFNAEFFRTLGFEKKVKLGSETVSHHTDGWGCNFGVPLMVRLTPGWDMQFIPYYLRLLFSDSQNIYGSTLLFSYRF